MSADLRQETHKALDNQGLCTVSADSVNVAGISSAPCRTRTYNPLIKSQML